MSSIGDRLALFRRERRVLRFGDLGVGDPGLHLVIPDGARVHAEWDRC